MDAMAIVRDPRGAAIAGRRITLSTVGVVPGIVRMADDASPLHLAVSLHGATDSERNALVPVGKRWPIAQLIEACNYYAHVRRRKVLFEWTLIAGRTDTFEQAQAVAALLRQVPCQLNVIPLNRTDGYDGAPSASDAIDRFRSTVEASGIPTSVRQRRAIEVAGGCGQLAAAAKEFRQNAARTEPHTH
jgi:23S rRNA (adenine2503-C2)-methyltransferase